LHGNTAPKAKVSRLVDRTHAASPDQTNEAVLAVDRSLDGERQRQLAPIGRANQRGGVVTRAAGRTLFQQIDVTPLEVREDIVAEAAILIDAILQTDVLARDRDPSSDRL